MEKPNLHWFFSRFQNWDWNSIIDRSFLFSMIITVPVRSYCCKASAFTAVSQCRVDVWKLFIIPHTLSLHLKFVLTDQRTRHALIIQSNALVYHKYNLCKAQNRFDGLRFTNPANSKLPHFSLSTVLTGITLRVDFTCVKKQIYRFSLFLTVIPERTQVIYFFYQTVL